MSRRLLRPDTVAKHLGVAPAIIRTLKRGQQEAEANSARAMVMYLCQREGDLRLRAIAAQFDLEHYASAGSSIRQFQKRLDQDSRLHSLVDIIKLDLTP